MPRPTNQELYEQEPDIDVEAQPAVAKVAAQYQATKELEGHANKDKTGYDVTVGRVEMSGETQIYRILEAVVSNDLTIQSSEERPDVPPGQEEKPDKPDKPEKPDKPGKPDDDDDDESRRKPKPTPRH